MTFRALLLLALTGWLASGCLLHRTTAFQHPPAPPADHPRSSLFDYPREGLEVHLAAAANPLPGSEYRVQDLQFSSAGVNGQIDNRVSVRYFQSRSPGPRPLVIILPLWGTYTFPPEKLAQGIIDDTQGGWHVMWVLGEDYLFDWPGLTQANSEAQFNERVGESLGRVATSVIDLRRLIDWTESRPEIKPGQIGLVGFSIGTLVAALALAHEPRLDVGALVMGGALPAEIFAVCSSRPAQVREAIMARFGWTMSQYREVFDRQFALGDPARYAGHYDAAGLLLVDARYDRCLTKKSRDALWLALGQPQRLTMGYGHKLSFLAMTPLGFNFLTRRIVRFLNRQFADSH